MLSYFFEGPYDGRQLEFEDAFEEVAVRDWMDNGSLRICIYLLVGVTPSRELLYKFAVARYYTEPDKEYDKSFLKDLRIKDE